MGSRPDGFTLHPDMEDRDRFVGWHRKKFFSNSSVLDEYTMADSSPYMILVSDELHADVLAHLAEGSKDSSRPPVYWGEGKTGPSKVTEKQLITYTNELVARLAAK